MKDKILGLIEKYQNRVEELKSEHKKFIDFTNQSIDARDKRQAEVYMELSIEAHLRLTHARIFLSELESLLEP